MLFFPAYFLPGQQLHVCLFRFRTAPCLFVSLQNVLPVVSSILFFTVWPPYMFYFFSLIDLADLAGFTYKLDVFAEHLSARSVALWQATSPLINFAASNAG